MDCAEFSGCRLTSNPSLYNNSLQLGLSEKNSYSLVYMTAFSNFSHNISLSLLLHTKVFPESFPSLHLAVRHPSSSCWWSCCRQSAHSPQREDSTHSFTTSLLLSHTRVYETIPAICLKLDIPKAAQISGRFEQFELSVEKKEDHSALRYEVCLNKPLRRVFSSWHWKLLKFCTSTMSLKKRKPSTVFSWHKSFAILAPWRKGKWCDSIYAILCFEWSLLHPVGSMQHLYLQHRWWFVWLRCWRTFRNL